MQVSRTLLAAAAVALFGLGPVAAQAAPPYVIVAGTGAVGADVGTFPPGTSGTIAELGVDWQVTATAGATTGYHVYNGVQTWSFTRNGAPETVNLEFAISGIDAWLTTGGAVATEAIGLPVGTVCDISNPAYVFPAGALDGTPGGPVFSWTPDNGSGLAVLQYLGNLGGVPVNRYLQYARSLHLHRQPTGADGLWVPGQRSRRHVVLAWPGLSSGHEPTSAASCPHARTHAGLCWPGPAEPAGCWRWRPGAAPPQAQQVSVGARLHRAFTANAAWRPTGCHAAFCWAHLGGVGRCRMCLTPAPSGCAPTPPPAPPRCACRRAPRPRACRRRRCGRRRRRLRGPGR